MKVAFDEHIPPVMARIFQVFANDKQFKKISGGLSFHLAKEFTPSPSDADYIRRSDAPWVRRFAISGGSVIISGNTKMKSVPHERLALVETGMVVIFFENKWNNWTFFSKCSLLLHWWPVIVKRVKTAKRGSFWHIPSVWIENGKLRAVSNEDLKLLKIERQKDRATRIRTARRMKKIEAVPDQYDFDELLKKIPSEDKKKLDPKPNDD